MGGHQNHLLHIPLLTSQSLPRLRKSLQSFINDPLVPELPRAAFCHLRNFNVYIAYLNLETPDRIIAARKFLGGLNFNKILDDVTRSSVQTAARTAKSLTPPLTVQIKTLFHRDLGPEANPDVSKCQRLFVNVVDPTSRLEKFRGAIRHLLEEAGFLKDLKPEKENAYHRSHKLLDLDKHNTKTLVFEKGEKEESNQSLKTFDATETLNKYKKYKWAEKFELEKLTLTKRVWSGKHLEGPEVPKYHQICSFPLRRTIPFSSPTGESVEMDRLRHMLTFADLAAEELPLGSITDRMRRKDIRYW